MIFRILEDQFAQKTRLSKAADQRFMQLALALGRRGQGRTWPNPAVGAVIVRDGVIVGRGWTQARGRAHPAAEAVRGAGASAPSGRRLGVRASARAAAGSMCRLSRARISGNPRPVPTPSSPPAF